MAGVSAGAVALGGGVATADVAGVSGFEAAAGSADFPLSLARVFIQCGALNPAAAKATKTIAAPKPIYSPRLLPASAGTAAAGGT
jgi:hypothetical protein